MSKSLEKKIEIDLNELFRGLKDKFAQFSNQIELAIINPLKESGLEYILDETGKLLSEIEELYKKQLSKVLELEKSGYEKGHDVTGTLEYKRENDKLGEIDNAYYKGVRDQFEAYIRSMDEDSGRKVFKGLSNVVGKGFNKTLKSYQDMWKTYVKIREHKDALRYSNFHHEFGNVMVPLHRIMGDLSEKNKWWIQHVERQLKERGLIKNYSIKGCSLDIYSYFKKLCLDYLPELKEALIRPKETLKKI